MSNTELSTARVTVLDYYRSFGAAYAVDDAGQRYLINEGTEGVSVSALQIGSKLTIAYNDRFYAVSATVG